MVGAVEGSDWACGGTAWRAAKHPGSRAARLRLARKPKWADADEALGEQMKQEATEKLIACEGHQFVLIVVGGVTPAKSNLAVVE